MTTAPRSWLLIGGPSHGRSYHADAPSDVIEVPAADPRPGDPADASFSLHRYHLRRYATTAQHPCVPGASGIITEYRAYVHEALPDNGDLRAAVTSEWPYRPPTYQDPWTLPTPLWRLRRERDREGPGHLLYYPPRRVNRLAELFRPYGAEQHMLGTAYLDGAITEADTRARMIACVPACGAQCVRPRHHPGDHYHPDTGAWRTDPRGA